MQFVSRQGFSSTPDMTTMIDCTFQLTFFFMLTLNFSTDIQSDLVRLPVSEIAKPSEGGTETRVTVQMLPNGMVLFGGEEMTVEALRGPMRREHDIVKDALGRNPASAAVVVRADRDVPVGMIQGMLRVCREAGFANFTLRAGRPK